jgi:hypothetical protein
VIGTAHFFSRRFDQAVPKLLLATQEGLPEHISRSRCLLRPFLGRLDEARGIIKRLRAVVPVLVPDLSYLRNSEQRELYLSGAPCDGRTRITTA